MKLEGANWANIVVCELLTGSRDGAAGIEVKGERV